MKKILAVILAVFVLSASMSFGISAALAPDDMVAPCYNNTSNANLVFGISNSGIATVGLTCVGISGRTTKIVAETKLERKVGIFWFDVDGAEWTDTAYTYYMSKGHDFQLTKTGTYRAKTTFTVSGSGGSNDVINAKVTDTY